MPGPRRRKPPKHNFPPLVLPDNCDESYVQDWAKYGLMMFAPYLAKHREFFDYCHKATPKEEEAS